jgi:hypothetical protein
VVTLPNDAANPVRITSRHDAEPDTAAEGFCLVTVPDLSTCSNVAYSTTSSAAVPMFLLFGGALIALGRYIARDEKAFLINYLREVLVARDAPEH